LHRCLFFTGMERLLPSLWPLPDSSPESLVWQVSRYKYHIFSWKTPHFCHYSLQLIQLSLWVETLDTFVLHVNQTKLSWKLNPKLSFSFVINITRKKRTKSRTTFIFKVTKHHSKSTNVFWLDGFFTGRTNLECAQVDEIIDALQVHLSGRFIILLIE